MQGPFLTRHHSCESCLCGCCPEQCCTARSRKPSRQLSPASVQEQASHRSPPPSQVSASRTSISANVSFITSALHRALCGSTATGQPSSCRVKSFSAAL